MLRIIGSILLKKKRFKAGSLTANPSLDETHVILPALSDHPGKHIYRIRNLI